MPKIRPIHGVVLVLAVVAALFALDGLRGSSAHHQRVSAGADGVVRIAVADLQRDSVRFYRYLSSANQEVKFFVGRDPAGTVQVAFDASENHFKLNRGFRFQNGWIVDNKCESSMRLASINGGGKGCSPVPLPHRLDGNLLQITRDDLLRGWRYFV